METKNFSCGAKNEHGDICGETYTCGTCRMENRFNGLLEERTRAYEIIAVLLAAVKAARALGTLGQTHTPAEVQHLLDVAVMKAEGGSNA